MKKIIFSFTIAIAIFAVILFARVYADDMVSGVVKSFDGRSGRLVIQSNYGGTDSFIVMPSVRVYLRIKGRDIEVSNPWQLLQDNLIGGTKVELLRSGSSILTIWIVEVPR